jgi:hypothetical protein
MAHQTWSQTSERLRGALQNVGIEVAFRLGRGDAEHSATILGRVNPLLVKHEVEDPWQNPKTHPTFYSLPEQWEGWVQAITDLRPREAFVRKPDGKVSKIKTLSVPDPVVDPDRLAEVEDHYLRTYFRPKDDIDGELGSYRNVRPPAGTVPSRVTRTRTVFKALLGC